MTAEQYIRRIRSPRKRAYAQAVWAYLTGAATIWPARGGLSYMAAQAVDMRLSAIKREAER